MGKKKRRSIQQRISDAKAELAELEAKQKQKSLSNALEEGLVSKENEAEFKKLQKEVAALTKAMKIADSYNNDEVKGRIERLRNMISTAMRSLIDGEEEEEEEEEEPDDEDDEYEEE